MHTYNCIDISTNSLFFAEKNNKINNYMKNLLQTKIIYLMKKLHLKTLLCLTLSKDSEI